MDEMLSDTIKLDKGGSGVLMIAHRGLSGLETENTECAFVAAGNRSYYGIETDVHFTKDGKYVISHDGNLSRVFGKNIEIKDYLYEDLRKVRKIEKGDNGQRSERPCNGRVLRGSGNGLRHRGRIPFGGTRFRSDLVA